MLMDCEKCLHKNVCKKRGEVNDLCGNLMVSYDLQTLKNLGISVDLSCIDYTTESMWTYQKEKPHGKIVGTKTIEQEED